MPCRALIDLVPSQDRRESAWPAVVRIRGPTGTATAAIRPATGGLCCSASAVCHCALSMALASLSVKRGGGAATAVAMEWPCRRDRGGAFKGAVSASDADVATGHGRRRRDPRGVLAQQWRRGISRWPEVAWRAAAGRECSGLSALLQPWSSCSDYPMTVQRLVFQKNQTFVSSWSQ